MSVYFVVRDRRSYGGRPQGWKRVALYDIGAVDKLTVVPDDILAHYLTKRMPPFGYASLDGLTQPQLRILTGLIKGRKVRAHVNRWGDIGVYRVEGLSSPFPPDPRDVLRRFQERLEPGGG